MQLASLVLRPNTTKLEVRGSNPRVGRKIVEQYTLYFYAFLTKLKKLTIKCLFQTESYILKANPVSVEPLFAMPILFELQAPQVQDK